MILVLWCALVQATGEDSDLAGQVRHAVERSLPWIEKNGTDWIREKKCSSCHEVTFMIWSHREALDHGLAVDPKKLDEWTRWAWDSSLAPQPKGGERGGGLDTMAQLLLARGTPDRRDSSASELAGLILALQKPEGFWKAGGQLPDQKRPREETNEASTRWVLYALSTLGPEDEARKAAREKAEEWLSHREPGKSTEPLALALLMTRSEVYRKELLAQQNEDGGWAFLKGDPSDALATGQVLYVLGSLDAADLQPIRRAWGFLLRTQLADGSWKVPSTKAKPKNDLMSSYWGTSWAAIGSLRTLPR